MRITAPPAHFAQLLKRIQLLMKIYIHLDIQYFNLARRIQVSTVTWPSSQGFGVVHEPKRQVRGNSRYVLRGLMLDVFDA